MDSSSIQQTRINLLLDDGWSLPLSIFEPKFSKKRKVIIVSAAIGARQERYYAFAEAFAHLGWTVVTFSYRGLGKSTPWHEGAPPPTLLDWGRKDLDGVIAWSRKHLHPSTMVAVLHSIAGQLIALTGNHHELDAAVSVSSPRHLWWLWTSPYRYLVYAFFKVFIPFSNRIFRRLPMAYLGLHDLPSDVAQQWADAGIYDDYKSEFIFEAKKGARSYHVPTLFLSFDDDHFIAPRATVDYLASSLFSQAKCFRRHIVPANIGLGIVGHSGFFDGAVPRSWWRILSLWLEKTAPLAFERGRHPKLNHGRA